MQGPFYSDAMVLFSTTQVYDAGAVSLRACLDLESANGEFSLVEGKRTQSSMDDKSILNPTW